MSVCYVYTKGGRFTMKNNISPVPVLLFVTCCCLFLFGCSGGVVTRTIAPSPTPNVKFVPAENTVVMSDIRKVAIFPFADYSHQQDHLGINAWGGNIKILEEITDHLVAHGLSVVIQEDVNTLLVDQDIIRPIDKEKYLIHGTFEEVQDTNVIIGSPEHELANYQHSPDMTDEIISVIKREKRKKKRQKSKSPVLQGATVGLSREKVIDVAQILDADLIIRGRILDYGLKDVGTLNPFYRGFVPVAIDSVKDLFFGATDSYGYENDLEDIENIMISAAMGYMIGHNVVSTSTSSHSAITQGLVSRNVSIKDRSHDTNEIEGAGVGAAAGWLASQHPKKAKRSAVVQVRIYAQDGETGDVLWSNRAEIEYTPHSNFSYNDTHPKTMFDKAVKESIKVLMDSFFADAESVMTRSMTTQAQKEGA